MEFYYDPTYTVDDIVDRVDIGNGLNGLGVYSGDNLNVAGGTFIMSDGNIVTFDEHGNPVK